MFGQKETCRHVELPCTGRFFRKNKYIDRWKYGMITGMFWLSIVSNSL